MLMANIYFKLIIIGNNKPFQIETFINYDVLKPKKLLGTKGSFYNGSAECYL